MEAQKNLLSEQIQLNSSKFDTLRQEIKKIIVGQDQIVTFSFIALLTNGHILLEGVPGVAKTTLIKTIADALGLDFSRVQFTPDLLPADIVGTMVYNPKNMSFDTKKGPLFANLVLADEINRSPAKVQSALLEAMQERQITIGSETYPLDNPFLVFATQNPIENEGTYELPEAQIDRFMFKLIVGYPTIEQEREILLRSNQSIAVHAVVSKTDLLEARALVKEIFMDDRLVRYILDIVFATREPEKYGLKSVAKMIQYGVSPRATIAIAQAARAYAFLQNRAYVTPDDVKFVARAILRHRIILTYQADVEGVTADMIIQTILGGVSAP